MNLQLNRTYFINNIDVFIFELRPTLVKIKHYQAALIFLLLLKTLIIELHATNKNSMLSLQVADQQNRR